MAFDSKNKDIASAMNVENNMEHTVYCSVLHDWELQRRASDGLSSLSLAVVLVSSADLLQYLFHCSLLQRIAQE